MTTDFKNGYAVGLQASISAYVEVIRTHAEGDIETVEAPEMKMTESPHPIETVEAPEMKMTESPHPIETVEAPEMKMTCIITEGE